MKKLAFATALGLALTAPAYAQAPGKPAQSPSSGAASSSGAAGQSGGAMSAPAATAAAPASMNVTIAQQFVPMVAISDMFEIESSRLALSKGQSSGVKQFAQHMVDDHTKSTANLKTAVSAAKVNVTMPTQLDARHQQMLDQLKSASGAQFDQMYATMQQQAHQEAVALFTAYSEKGDQTEIKSFASKTLPTLKQHQAMAKDLPKGS